jgi:hypothetical protein
VTRPYYLGKGFEPIFNPFWNVIITMSTVGYGDLYPITSLGRLSAIIAMMAGSFITSLILLAMSISSKYSLEEQRTFKSVKDYDYFIERIKRSATIITIYSQIRLLKRGIVPKKYERLGAVKADAVLSIMYVQEVRRFNEFNT